MTAQELRQKYFDFFRGKGHKVIPSASLIPENDPTVLFTTAGMHPLVPYLLGEAHPLGKRLVDAQKCVRTSDIDEVGDSWHLTFFEMLGNWSLGDYWKKEAIEWSFEFLTDKKWLGIAPEKLSVTVFAGDEDAPADEESVKIWQELGIPKERIFYLPKEDNWWGPAGQTGPCGPCTEMFYDTGKEKCGKDCRPGCSCGKYAEVWNDVFMEYNKELKTQNLKLKTGVEDYEFVKLEQKNVDTGMGVERTVAVLNSFDNVYETELFLPIIKKIEEISGKKYNSPQPPLKLRGGDDVRAIRIIADHLKAAVFLLAEGLEPSNVERGYVLRRLIRRAVRYGKQLGIREIFTFKVAQVVIDMYREIYPELWQNKDFIEEQLVREEEKFSQTLEKGLKEFERLTQMALPTSTLTGSVPPEAGPSPTSFNRQSHLPQRLSGEQSFYLYQTYGFPKEMMQELCREKNIEFDEKGFDEELKKHQELSRAGAEQKFKGGLADHSEIAVKYHTANHLLLVALRYVLGGQVAQRGSNITAERLRFDFSHPQKMMPEEIKKVEDLVNEKIQEDLTVQCDEMNLEEAKAQGATGVFESRYGERVKVYTIGDPSTSSGLAPFSREICGGPHVERTGVLGKFKIIKEEASSAGVRRIKAVLE